MLILCGAQEKYMVVMMKFKFYKKKLVDIVVIDIYERRLLNEFEKRRYDQRISFT